VTSPAAVTSNKAGYKLLCSQGAARVGASASVAVPATTTTCPATPPRLTAAGTISDTRAETVSCYWALSDGANSAPATVTFARPGTMAAAPLAVTPPTDPGSGQAVLVVTSPVAAASSPAAYTLACKAPAPAPAALTASAAVSPAAQTLTACTGPVPAFTFTGTIGASKPGTVSYFWELPGGNSATRTLTFAKAGSQTVTAAYKPASTTASGPGTLVVTSPASVTSNAAAFTLTCGAALTVTNNAPATATAGTPYSGTVTVAGGNGTYTWSDVTGLPAGLSATASGATLTISGTPQAAGTASATVTVSDTEATPQSKSTTVSITVSAAPLRITSGAPPNPEFGGAYSFTFAASGGTGAVTWAVSGLPAGITQSGATISGTPSASGTFTIRVTATAGTTATAAYTITIAPPVLL
jgi:hypothetical protein